MSFNKTNLALIGFMGAGKTSLGGLLSRSLNMAFLDMDAEIEKQIGMPVSQIFAEFGEGYFRALEHKLCKKIALDSELRGSAKGLVIATGGGVLTDSRNAKLLRKYCVVVFLEASPETLCERLKDDDSRPLLAGSLMQVIRKLVNEREAAYREAADFVVCTDGKSLEEVCEEILDCLEATC